MVFVFGVFFVFFRKVVGWGVVGGVCGGLSRVFRYFKRKYMVGGWSRS